MRLTPDAINIGPDVISQEHKEIFFHKKKLLDEGLKILSVYKYSLK